MQERAPRGYKSKNTIESHIGDNLYVAMLRHAMSTKGISLDEAQKMFREQATPDKSPGSDLDFLTEAVNYLKSLENK